MLSKANSLLKSPTQRVKQLALASKPPSNELEYELHHVDRTGRNADVRTSMEQHRKLLKKINEDKEQRKRKMDQHR